MHGGTDARRALESFDVRALERSGRDRPDLWHGYQVVGVAFASGHVLTFRRLLAPGAGAFVSSVWMHHPLRGWTLVSDDVARDPWCANGACGAAGAIDAVWSGAASLTVRVPDAGLAWTVHVGRGVGLHALSAVGRRARLWRNPLGRRALRGAAGVLLGSGSPTLEGTTPSGTRFEILPDAFWSVTRSVAYLHGQHLGPMVLLGRRPALGGLAMPGWGYAVVGTERLEGRDGGGG